MSPVVPLDAEQNRLLDALAGVLRAPPLGWPSAARASSIRVAVAMETRQVPAAEDLCRVLFLLLDEDRVRRFVEEKEARIPETRPSAALLFDLHGRLGLSMASVGTTEILDGATVYFPPL
jgi:hypothetical protein